MKNCLLRCLIAVCLILVSCSYQSTTDKNLTDALASNDTNLIRRYLDSGGDVNQNIRYVRYDVVSAPLIDIAIQSGRTNMVDFLLREGADPNRKDMAGLTPLLWVIGRALDGVPFVNRITMLSSLIHARVDINLRASKGLGWTPLSQAADYNQPEIIKMLLDNGAFVNETNYEGQTAIFFAANHNIAKLLLDAGADLSIRAGETPAESASRQGRMDVVALLTNVISQPTTIKRNR